MLAEHPCFDYAAWRIWILDHSIGAPPAGLGWLGWPARKLRLALGFRRLMFALWPLAAWFVPPSCPGIAVGVVASLRLSWTFEVVELPWRTWRSGWARLPGARRTQIAHLCWLASACSAFAWAAWFGAWPMALASLAPLLPLSIHQGILRTSQPSHHDLALEPLLVGLALLSLALLAFGGDTAHRWGFWRVWVLASLVHWMESLDWVLPTREDAAPQATATS